jgi:spore maturation protein CgeB
MMHESADKWPKTVLTVLLQWDYGKPERGESCEKLWFYDNMVKLVERVIPFWYDDYLEDLPRLQELLLETAGEVQPDLIFFIPFQEQFTRETLDQLKTRHTTIAWFGDDTWRFDSFSSHYAPHFTLIATTDPFSLGKYRDIGAAPILTEWAAAAPVSEVIVPLGNNEDYQYAVSFVGGHNAYRAWFISRLERAGITVDCFGAGWPRGRVGFAEMEQIFRKSRINLNISNSVNHDIRFVLGGVRNLKNYLRSPKQAEQVKARNFEIPVAGGFQLTNYVPGIERHFLIGSEIAVYTTPEDCIDQIRYYLANEGIRTDVVARSHDRARTEHTYEQRLAHILDRIWLDRCYSGGAEQ